VSLLLTEMTDSHVNKNQLIKVFSYWESVCKSAIKTWFVCLCM